MSRSLGIHIQPNGWSFVLLDGNSRKWSVRAHDKGTAEPGDRPRRNLGAALAKGLKRSGGKVDQVILTLPSSGSVLRELSLPFSDREKIEQVLKFEVESDLYHLSIDEVVCDFVELADERATSTLLVAATPKEYIQDSLDILSRAGMDPQTVELDLGALCTAIGTYEMSEEDGAQAFLHVGGHTTLLLVAGADGVRFVRSLPFGWQGLVQGESVDVVDVESEEESVEEESDSDSLDEDGEDGEDGGRKLFGAKPDIRAHSFEEAVESADAGTYEAFISRLVGSVRRGLSAASIKPSAVHLLGDELPLLCEKLTGRLGVSSSSLALGLPAESQKDEDATVVSPDPVSLGAALRGLGHGGSEMNFRQEEFRFARGMERIAGALTLMLVGLIAWLLVDSVILYRKTQSLQQRTDDIYERAALFVEKLNDDLSEEAPDAWRIRTRFSEDFSPLNRMPNLRNRLMAAKRDLDEMVGEAGIELPQSCLNAWNLLFGVMERELEERFNGRWMLEGLEFLSIDKKTKSPAHVLATVTVTIFSDGQDTDLHRFEALSGALQAQPWCIGTVETPGGFKATKDNEPGTRTGVIKVKINTTGAREGKA